jgi:2-(1,2-epoxy-1,2-dihydrophenyl)acetyl-CoA isomerase
VTTTAARVRATTYETILVDKDGPVATITMNRPDRMNGMTNLMLVETGDALASVAEDRDIRVVVITGAGRAFCPGADLNRVASGEPEVRLTPEDFRVPVLLHQMPAVTIAAINGACAGAGLGWACACDFRIAARSARFNTAFLDVGVAGDMGGPWTLSRLVGAAKARELYFLPDKFGAEEAHRIGLVNGVVDDEDLSAEVERLVGRLVAAAPLALRALKANFVDAERVDFPAFVALETERHLRMFTTQDTKEAFAAKVEKRAPRFEGR